MVDIPLAVAVHNTFLAAARNSPAVADSFALAVECHSMTEVGRKHFEMVGWEQVKRRSLGAVAWVGSRRVKGRRRRCKGQVREKARGGGWE